VNETGKKVQKCRLRTMAVGDAALFKPRSRFGRGQIFSRTPKFAGKKTDVK
jgi:hypothetical protein